MLECSLWRMQQLDSFSTCSLFTGMQGALTQYRCGQEHAMCEHASSADKEVHRQTYAAIRQASQDGARAPRHARPKWKPLP